MTASPTHTQHKLIIGFLLTDGKGLLTFSSAEECVHLLCCALGPSSTERSEKWQGDPPCRLVPAAFMWVTGDSVSVLLDCCQSLFPSPLTGWRCVCWEEFYQSVVYYKWFCPWPKQEEFYQFFMDGLQIPPSVTFFFLIMLKVWKWSTYYYLEAFHCMRRSTIRLFVSFGLWIIYFLAWHSALAS